MSRTKYDCKYYENAKNKAIEDHMLKGILITTKSNETTEGKKEAEPLEIHETDVEKAKQSFVQCHIPRNKDPEKIRCKIPSRYFISKTYGQVIRIEKKSGKAFWIKPEYYFDDDESRVKVKMNDKYGEYNVPVAGLYGIVFGCPITEKAKSYLRKKPLGAFIRNGDKKKKEGVQVHHINGYENTRESEGIYDEKELEILTKPLHQDFITIMSRKYSGNITEMDREEILKAGNDFSKYADNESPNKDIVHYSGSGKGKYEEIDTEGKFGIIVCETSKRKIDLYNKAMKNPACRKQLYNFVDSLEKAGQYQTEIRIDKEPVKLIIVKY